MAEPGWPLIPREVLPAPVRRTPRATRAGRRAHTDAGRQLSIFGAETTEPSPADLAGLLAGPGQLGRMGGTARVSVRVDAAWRVHVLVAELVARGLVVQWAPLSGGSNDPEEGVRRDGSAPESGARPHTPGTEPATGPAEPDDEPGTPPIGAGLARDPDTTGDDGAQGRASRPPERDGGASLPGTGAGGGVSPPHEAGGRGEGGRGMRPGSQGGADAGGRVRPGSRRWADDGDGVRPGSRGGADDGDGVRPQAGGGADSAGGGLRPQVGDGAVGEHGGSEPHDGGDGRAPTGGDGRRGRTGPGVAVFEVRTAYSSRLNGLARAWPAAAEQLFLGGPRLRLWVAAAGAPLDDGYALGLDPGKSAIPVDSALRRVGLQGTVSEDGLVYLITGRKRLARLAELVGDRPEAAPADLWPDGAHA